MNKLKRIIQKFYLGGENMLNNFKIIHELLQHQIVPFIVHAHQPRSGSLHYDLRFGNPRNSKELFSFAAPANFLQTINNKTILAKTKMHDSRWLDLRSYRLKEVDRGTVTIKIATSKYFELEFHGKVLNDNFKLFRLSSTFRNDRWLLVKTQLH